MDRRMLRPRSPSKGMSANSFAPTRISKRLAFEVPSVPSARLTSYAGWSSSTPFAVSTSNQLRGVVRPSFFRYAGRIQEHVAPVSISSVTTSGSGGALPSNRSARQRSELTPSWAGITAPKGWIGISGRWRTPHYRMRWKCVRWSGDSNTCLTKNCPSSP